MKLKFRQLHNSGKKDKYLQTPPRGREHLGSEEEDTLKVR